MKFITDCFVILLVLCWVIPAFILMSAWVVIEALWTISKQDREIARMKYPKLGPITLLTLLTTLLTLPTLQAQPIACNAYVHDNYFIVEWCNLTPNSDWYVEWSENATDWLIESPSYVVRDLSRPSGLDGTVTIELEMTSPSLFVRLVEYPVRSAGFSPSPRATNLGQSPDGINPELHTK